MLYSRSLLFTYFVCSSVYLLIPDSKFITSPFGIHKVVFSMSLLLFCAMLCWVAHSCPTLCDPMDRGAWWPTVHGDSPGKSTGVGCHALLQGIFLTQGSNPGLLLCRWVLYHLSHQGSWQKFPKISCIKTAQFWRSSGEDIVLSLLWPKLQSLFGELRSCELYSMAPPPKNHWIYIPKTDELCYVNYISIKLIKT